MSGYQIYRALQNTGQSRSGLEERRHTGAVDFSRTTPTQLPEALRTAAERALGHAADPLNQLDHNPYIGELWAIVADEMHSLARALERRYAALFDGHGGGHRATQMRYRRPADEDEIV